MNILRALLLGPGTKEASKREKAVLLDDPNVYPIHTLDSLKAYETFVAAVMLFNDVLDAEMLNNSLSRLLEIGDWRKLGGRLERGVRSGKQFKLMSWQYH